MRLRDRKYLIPFALLCFAITAYDISSAGLYAVGDVCASIPWLKGQYISSILFGVFLLWFVSDFIGRTSRKWDYAFSAVWLVPLVVVIFLPQDYVWTGEAAIKDFSFFGIKFVYYESATRPLATIREFVGVVAVGYVIISLIRFSRQVGRRESGPVLVGIFLFCVAVLNDALIAVGTYHSFYLMEWGFMALVFGVTNSISISHSQVRMDLDAAEVQRRRLAGAVNDAGESIMITDMNGVIQYINPAFERMTGYAAGECVGQKASMLKSGKHDAMFYKDMWERIKSGRTWQGTFMNRRKDGGLFEEEATISPIYDERGKIVSCVAVKRDVTKERHMEKQILRSQNMSAIGQFTHLVAHDFNNALAVILGTADMIQVASEKGKCEQMRDFALQIKEAGRGIAKLNGALIAFSNPAKLQMRKLRLDRLLIGMEDLLKHSLSRNVSLVIDVSQDHERVLADQSRIEQSVMQLVQNAAEALNDRGAITISLRKAMHADAAVISRHSGLNEDDPDILKFLIITVRDTGSGISEDAITRIFDPFFTTKTKARHPGLGLSNVWQTITDEHGGLVHVESVPGQGTVFELFLPIAAES
ncbi:MAG: hypothetical protein A2283_00275 [Lentisphaerae bacterium RIFOXYA12_FULL_48_11]|nr:MAG: hypothetical protein A2283_00275 [Lentisphaerae bacterium RIFOXYA12_FULL_48_11]